LTIKDKNGTWKESQTQIAAVSLMYSNHNNQPRLSILTETNCVTIHPQSIADIAVKILLTVCCLLPQKIN